MWLSLKNAAALSFEIAARLGWVDGDNQEVYATNAAEYVGRLNALDAHVQGGCGGGQGPYAALWRPLPVSLPGGRLWLRLLRRLAGCSAETEASFETIIFLAKKMDELGLNTVLTIESDRGKIARTIVENTAAKIRKGAADGFHAVRYGAGYRGRGYLSWHHGKNLSVLKEALM